MKKTASIIYRFIFIIFSVWGIAQKLGFNILWLTARIMNFTLLVDILCFLCILAVFIIGITHKPSGIILAIKTALTFCSGLVLLENFSIFKAGLSYEWILGILLPAMMIIDWLVFDDKGKIRLRDLLIWICAAAGLLLGTALLLKTLFGIDDVWNVLGMFKDWGGLRDLVLKALGIAAFLYIFDCLYSALVKRKFDSAFSLIYRIIFLVLEIYAIINTLGNKMTSFLYGLKYYHILVNFLCVVCIAVVLIINLVKFRSIRKSTTPFPRLQAAFTIAALFLTAAHIVFCGRVYELPICEIIFYYIAPLMMLFDWILFDRKGSFRLTDPLLWLLIPFIYFVAAKVYLIPYAGVDYAIFYQKQPETAVICAGAILIGGYALFLADRLASRR